MTLIEEGQEDIESHLRIWDLHRRTYLLMYYARSKGYKNLGLQPLPVLAASEYNGKNAIAMQMLLKDIQKTPFGREKWTLGETSVETVLATEPKGTFKKKPYIVDVWFDNQQQNAFPYTNWREIIYQDSAGNWQKAEGKVSYDGLYYTEENGNQVYFQLFATDAPRYGLTGQWTVHVENEILYPPVTSSSGPQPVYAAADQSTDSGTRVRQGPDKENVDTNEGRQAESSPSTGLRRPREASPEQSRKRPRPDSTDGGGGGGRRRGGNRGESGEGSWPSPEQVGTRHTGTPRRGLSRVGRLQEDAWDPPIILVKGPPNPLKCWRNRCCQRHSDLFVTATSCFKWIKGGQHGSRLIIAFKSPAQRAEFLNNVHIPKHCDYTYGNLMSL